MRVLSNCSFREFDCSDFASEFIKEDDKGRMSFTSEISKLVFCTDECCFGQYLHTFYDKGNKRWIKRLDLSDEQLFDDCMVYLMGDAFDNPEEIVMEVGISLFRFPLSEDMKKSLNESRVFEIENYFPNWIPNWR